MNVKSNSFNIAIAPPATIVGPARQLSRQLKDHGGRFVLDQRLYSTHITLYMTEFPTKNISAIRRSLNRLASTQKPFKIKALGYRQDKDGWIDIAYERSKSILKLHQGIITSLNPYRQGLIRAGDKEGLKSFSGPETNNIERYGYRSIGGQFKPHLTLTKLVAYKAGLTKKLQPYTFSFVVTEIGFFYLGEYGTCKKLIVKFKLGRGR